MSTMRTMLIGAVSALLIAVIGWGSRAPYQAAAGDHALLRLSWRMRGERSENCRDRTAQELEALPVHMRTPRVCERAPQIPYRLVVAIDGGKPDTTLTLPAGAKHDRPIYVLRDSALSPGPHHVSVMFARADHATQPPLTFDAVLDFGAGFIELITIAEDSPRLIHHSARQRSEPRR
jgi:hypothetical protein